MVRYHLKRGTAATAASVLVAGLTVGLASVPSAANEAEENRQEQCANADALAGAGDNFEAECLTEAELAEAEAAIDAAAAADAAAAYPMLAAGETASSDNLQHIANIPKQAPFSAENAYNSDIAFQGKYAFTGNYNGFTVYDISNPRMPSVVATVVCPGSQNDITVYGNLLFLSTDSARTDDSCSSGTTSLQNPSGWEGMKIWDISDITNPEYIKSVRTDCGSHTHTLVPGKDGQNLYIYVSSYGPNASAAYCRPPHDKISIIEVPLANPTAAAITSTPVLFPDGGYTNTAGCHDITAYPEIDLAAGACMGDGILMDISDPKNPEVTSRVRDTANFAFWHSATFNNDGTKVVFTDELGGGGGAICRPAFRDNQGANGIYDIVDGELQFASYYKIPRENSVRENCVAHNGTLVPVKGKDIMVQAWYQGGISAFDFTDSGNPTEIAWFDRGELSTERLILGGSWSVAYYNGYVYSSDIQKGFDVLEFKDPTLASAKGNPMTEFNAQTQPRFIDAPGKR